MASKIDSRTFSHRLWGGVELACCCGLDFVLSANAHRGHLTAEGKRAAIAAALKADPAKSDRAIAEQLKDDHKKVGRVRRALEATGALPHSETTVGKDGKSGPAKKSDTTRKPAKPKKQNTAVAAVPPESSTTQIAPAAGAEADFDAAVAAYAVLTDEARRRFIDHVIAGEAITLVEIALGRLPYPTQWAIAERIMKAPIEDQEDNRAAGNADARTKH